MIRVIQQGAAWTVVQDGKLLREGAGAAVHKTRAQAERHAARLAAKLQDQLQEQLQDAPAHDRPAADAEAREMPVHDKPAG